LNKFGAQVLSREPIPPGSYGVLDLPVYQLVGVGHIRYCTPRRDKFAIGMEFRNSLIRSYSGDWTYAVVTHS